MNNRNIICRRREGGFTLIEIAIAIVVLGGIAWLIMPMFATTTDAAAHFETDRKLKDLKQTLFSGYKANALEIDNATDAVITVQGQNVLSNAIRATSSSFAWAAPYASSSPAQLAKDGYGAPFFIFVSNRLSNNLYGVTLYSHKIAIVSAGRNGRLDNGTAFDVTTGNLTLKGDDMAEVVDGFQIEREIIDLTKKRIAAIANAYHAYFLQRFQSNPSRDLSVNYFSNGPRANADPAMFDTEGVIPSTGGTDATATNLLGTTMGLSTEDYKDGYGNDILVDNSSDAVRSPDNSSGAMQAPPYTVLIKGQLPGNEVFSQSLVGSF